ncbi:hypothetical protein Rvan_1899 [Rhodomicrobium vannielii ATCC 17100]|uniref:Uncharacterized protein n=1 Tax=Rhodomicrobium vannielii (strain ATCC 17100 / DSM 162 / LMG 4299 / NCIMB 10020 / ATH 3.1.1) TaxID=648757 RepID=E3I0P5_RHOVT|nr:hypothetical protein [Rhodomicrobium vannielii]ADP71135.1 hypothetical protein Rvan_1899 [Rhodomicrobium vannielii ATCC 17100]
MPAKTRYFSDMDDHLNGRGITPSQLKRLSRERQNAYMRYWFERNFEDPAHETPYESREGGYQYLWGGPYDALEELEAEFGSIIRFERIEEAAKNIEDEDGILEWAPGLDHSDKKPPADEWEEEILDEKLKRKSLDDILIDLKSGITPKYGDDAELQLRQTAIEKLVHLKQALAASTPSHGAIGHNRPPFDEEASEEAAVHEAREAQETISAELTKQEPNALQVAEATSRLQKVSNWLGNKADKAVDHFVEAFGKAAGTAIVGGLAAVYFPSISEAVQAVTEWLAHITAKF